MAHPARKHSCNSSPTSICRPHLQEISKPFHDLAHQFAAMETDRPGCGGTGGTMTACG